MDQRKNKSGNKTYLIFIIVLLILLGIFFVNLLSGNETADVTNKSVKANLSTIITFDYSKVTSVESKIKEIEDTESRGNFDTSRKLTKAQYKRIFSTSAIVGDSITEGLTAYGFLNSDNVFCEIGASVMHSDELFTQVANTYPKFVFFSFGMNDMGNYTGHADMFITKYKKLIEDFKKVSPDTYIYINGITPPSPDAIAKNSIYSNYTKFNKAIKAMCKDLNIIFIDNTEIIKSHPEFYSDDGIHVASDYYPLWLNNMIKKAGL